MITVKSIKKEWIWDLVTSDDELRAYACDPDFQARKAAITDAILRREAEGYKKSLASWLQKSAPFMTSIQRC